MGRRLRMLPLGGVPVTGLDCPHGCTGSAHRPQCQLAQVRPDTLLGVPAGSVPPPDDTEPASGEGS